MQMRLRRVLSNRVRPPFQAAGHSDNFSTFEFTAENRFFAPLRQHHSATPTCLLQAQGKDLSFQFRSHSLISPALRASQLLGSFQNF